MAKLLRQQNIEVLVDFYGFAFQEEDDTQVPVRYPEGRNNTDASFLTSHEMRVDIRSAGHTHSPSLAVEVWDGPPPPDAREAWEVQGEGAINSTTGRLAIWVIGGAEKARIDLGRAALWRLRLYCTGREEVARLASLDVPEGAERYLAQFWLA